MSFLVVSRAPITTGTDVVLSPHIPLTDRDLEALLPDIVFPFQLLTNLGSSYLTSYYPF